MAKTSRAKTSRAKTPRAKTPRNQYVPDVVSPPGGTLEDMLEERGMSQAELAERTGRPKKTINEILKGKAAITPETALQLELVLGAPAAFWNQRERDYRAYLARKDEDDRLCGWAKWQQCFPLRDMIKHGWLPDVSTRADKVRALLRFFEVASPEQWQEVHAARQVNFRKSQAYEADEAALSVWLARAEHLASEIPCQGFDKKGFRDALLEIRGLTNAPIRDAVSAAVSKCAAVGVAVALVPEVKGCRASGATRWLSADKALLQLSLRYKTNDHFWFTFFHEAGHILLHGKREVFLESNGHGDDDLHDDDDDLERAANKFAADLLIPPKDVERLRRLAPKTSHAIRAFARSIGIAPGIVVGRLQHDKLLPYTHCNNLKSTLPP